MSGRRAYYNEHDPYAAQWLRNLIAAGHIADGDVDERSIDDVCPADLRGYTQCHFFAGIGVWSYALRAAGWIDDRPVWTGSCPCQPFSAAGKGGGFADERHLWPHWFHLISQCRPGVVFGEQVASGDGLGWLDLVQADLEGAQYACGAVDICSAGFGGHDIRQRLYYVADADMPGSDSRASSRQQPIRHENSPPAHWRKVRRIRCSDGLVRAIEPGAQSLAHGIARRMDKLRAYGNAINAEAAAAFIRAYLDVEHGGIAA